MSPLDPGWKERVGKRYKELKEKGESFFPYTISKDLAACFLVFLVICGLALWKGAELEPMADPTVTDYNPRPEWYFLFFFEMLKYFPGRLEALATVAVPGLIAALLVLLPFLDRGPKRHPYDRPAVVSAGLLMMAAVVILSVKAALSPAVNPAVAVDPQVLEGRRIYAEMRCGSCHSINGTGGTLGPVLDSEGRRRDPDWLKAHFRDPSKMSAGSAMPNFGLLDYEVEDLTAFLASQGGESYPPEAPGLFLENCTSCHHLGAKGNLDGIDLTEVGLRHDAAFIERYVTNPEKVSADATMPPFSENLSKDDIKGLARYLAAQRGENGAKPGSKVKKGGI